MIVTPYDQQLLSHARHDIVSAAIEWHYFTTDVATCELEPVQQLTDLHSAVKAHHDLIETIINREAHH